jgi:hypothetical protein
VHTGFVTGTLASMSRHLAAASTETGGHAHLARARLLLGVWCAFFVGAVLGGAATYGIGTWAPLPPLVILLALALPGVIAGSVFVESVFAWPGMGRAMLAAIASRDYPVVMGATLVYAALVIAANLLADLALPLIDPRRR